MESILSSITDSKAAYCAGLFDGEGSTLFQVINGKYRAIKLVIKMCDNEPIQKFWEFTGGKGKIYYRDYSKEKSAKAHYRNAYVIDFSSFELVQFVICLMWKWLSKPKREQAKNVLEIYCKWGKHPK